MLSQEAQIAAALPAFMNPTRFLRVAFTECSQNPDLYECSPRSLLGAFIQCAQLGLEPNRTLGHVYLVPFRNRKRGTVDVTVIVGYRGLLILARRSGDISTIHAHLVHEGDAFSYRYGSDPMIEHVPAAAAKVIDARSGQPGGAPLERPISHVYAVSRMKDGGVQFEVMTLAEVEAHRDRYAHVSPDSAWTTNFPEMALKTVLRRLCRLLPQSPELQRAITLDTQARHAEPQELSALVAGMGDDVDAPERPAPPPSEAEQQEAAAVRARVVAALDAHGLAGAERVRVIKHETGEEQLDRASLDGLKALETALAARAAATVSAPAPADPPFHPPTEPIGGVTKADPLSETELALRRSVVIAKRERLGINDTEWARLVVQHGGITVEKLGTASLDSLDALDQALTALEQRKGKAKA